MWLKDNVCPCSMDSIALIWLQTTFVRKKCWLVLELVSHRLGRRGRVAKMQKIQLYETSAVMLVSLRISR